MIKVSVQAKKVMRTLDQIQRRDIPAAKASAFKRAGAKATTVAARRLAQKANVPYWMIRGVKGRGGRISKTKYNRKLDGILIFLRHRHINPAGTKHKAARVTTSRSGVRATKRVYKDAYYAAGSYSPGAIYVRNGGRREVAKIELGSESRKIVAYIVRNVAPPEFKKRFDHEFNRRIKRRGAR